MTDPAPGTTISSTSCATKTVQLYDPITGAIVPGNKYATTPTWNAQALALQKYLPAINPAVDPNGCGTVTYAIPSQVYDKQLVTRMDYTINKKNHLYGRYLLDGYQAPSFFSPTNILLATPAPGNYERVQTATIGEDFTINSRTVNSAHATVTRRVDVRSSAPGINACTLGINQYCAVPTGFQSTITSKFSTYCGTCAPGHYNDNSLSFDDDVTMLVGKHQLVFGGEYVRNQLNIVGAYQSNGNFTFSGIWSGSAAGNGSGGDADLDLLEGAMSSYSQSKQQSLCPRHLPCQQKGHTGCGHPLGTNLYAGGLFQPWQHLQLQCVPCGYDQLGISHCTGGFVFLRRPRCQPPIHPELTLAVLPELRPIC